MAAFLALVGAAVGLGVGLWAGLFTGRRIRGRREWVFWAFNGLALLIGLLVNIAGLAAGSLPLALVGPGFVAGGITGLKYGYGRVVGAWSAIDRMADTAALMGRHADAGTPAPPSRKRKFKREKAEDYGAPGRHRYTPEAHDDVKVDPKASLGRPPKRPHP